MLDINIQGSIVALVTPMTEDGQIDWESLARLVERQITAGTHAIVVAGTTGESATLSMMEHTEVIAAVVRAANKNIPVIAGTGANSTQEAIELTQAAKAVGADACLLVTPYYNKPTQEGLYQHFKMIAKTVAIPQILYNVPGRTGCDLQNETVERLLSFSNIVGIKDATGNIERGQDLLNRCGNQLLVYSGDDLTALELMRRGAKGNISVTANVAPKEMANMCKAVLQNHLRDAETINEQLMPLNRALFVESNPIPVKWALAEMGLIKNCLRLPMTPLSEKYHAELRQALHKAGVM